MIPGRDMTFHLGTLSCSYPHLNTDSHTRTCSGIHTHTRSHIDFGTGTHSCILPGIRIRIRIRHSTPLELLHKALLEVMQAKELFQALQMLHKHEITNT